MSVIKEVKTQTHKWEAVEGTVTGSSHIQENKVCQDKTYIMRQGSVLAAALADGAGSAVLSHHGAELVVRETCRMLVEGFDRYYNSSTPLLLKKELLEKLIGELETMAQLYECEVKDLASTLLAVAVKDDRFLVVHLGDGVVGYSRGSELKTASVPQNGEFANTTYFVTSPQAFEMMKIRKGQSVAINGFILMSDGSENSLYSRQRNELAPILQRLLYRLSVTSSEYLEPVIQASLEDVIKKKTRDDCSLVLISKHLRTYDEMSDDEMNDFFDIRTSGKHAAFIRRKRYQEILDALDSPQSKSELQKAVGIKNGAYFERKWLIPLCNLGYIVRNKDDKYRRVVNSCQCSKKKEEVKQTAEETVQTADVNIRSSDED